MFAEKDLAIEAKNSDAYNAAETLLQTSHVKEAILAFEALEGYKDSALRVKQIQENEYMAAEELLADGDMPHAAMTFYTLGDYADSRERSFAIWDQIAHRDTIVSGSYHTLGLKKDGTVYKNELK